MPGVVPNLTDVIAISAGGGFSVALKSDGTVWSWGDNSSGQLGRVTTENNPAVIPGLNNVIAISAGSGFTTALKADGTVWTFGANGFGQLGRSIPGNYSNVPTQLTGLPFISAISGRYLFTMALASDGTVWSWGLNESGELGRYTTPYFDGVPDVVPGLNGVVSVAAGGFMALVRKGKGEVWRMGAGVGFRDLTFFKPTPRLAYGVNETAQIAEGYFFRLALRSDGTVYSDGSNLSGEMGRNASQNSPEFGLIPSLTNVAPFTTPTNTTTSAPTSTTQATTTTAAPVATTNFVAGDVKFSIRYVGQVASIEHNAGLTFGCNGANGVNGGNSISSGTGAAYSISYAFISSTSPIRCFVTPNAFSGDSTLIAQTRWSVDRIRQGVVLNLAGGTGNPQPGIGSNETLPGDEIRFSWIWPTISIRVFDAIAIRQQDRPKEFGLSCQTPDKPPLQKVLSILAGFTAYSIGISEYPQFSSNSTCVLTPLNSPTGTVSIESTSTNSNGTPGPVLAGRVSNGISFSESTAANETITVSYGKRYSYASEGRLLDTRPGGRTADNVAASLGKRGPNSTTMLQVADRLGIVAGASVSLNVTIVDPENPGFLTVYPCTSVSDEFRPNASNINFVRGQTIANLVLTKVSDSGAICLYTSSAAHILVDVAGASLPAAPLQLLSAPARFLDSRVGSNTIDGVSQGLGTRVAGSVTEVVVTGRGGIPNGRKMVAMTLAAVDPSDDGYLSVYPCGTQPPNASNLNFVRGQTIANSAFSQTDSAGKVCVYSSASTHLLIDVSGYVDGNFGNAAPIPIRLRDTRRGDGPQASGSTYVLPISRSDPSSDGVVVNVTAVDAKEAGFITLFPCQTTRPNISNLNFSVGATAANLAIVQLSGNDELCVFTSGKTDVLIDLIAEVSGK